jgi:hypothetical protein
MGTASLIFLAFVASLAITLQGQFMGLMDRALGTKESIFITYASGGLIITITKRFSSIFTQNSGITF